MFYILKGAQYYNIYFQYNWHRGFVTVLRCYDKGLLCLYSPQYMYSPQHRVHSCMYI